MRQDGVKKYIEVLDEVFQLNVLHVMLELPPFPSMKLATLRSSKCLVYMSISTDSGVKIQNDLL